MITTEIFGKIKNKSKLIKFVDDVVMHLLPYPYKREIFIAIEFTNDLENAGECVGDRHSADITIAKQIDGIEISTRDICLTIAHELVHAKQYIKGQTNPSKPIWRGINYSNVSYRGSPWEKEAYLMEDKLVEMFYD
jgi:hypothetical protein|tara:strand:+ start:1045 stop:1452 length:408 start_codon:yes stop_codon:yes gene_type:complete